MKRVLVFLVFLIFLFSTLGFVSASVELSNSANSVYNLGEIINLDVNIVADEIISDSFSVSLICGLKEVEVYKEFASMSEGDVREREVLIPLIENFIGTARGDCYISYSLGSVSGKLVENIKISEKIEIDLDMQRNEFKPLESAVFSGNVAKENGKQVKGILELVIKGVDKADVFSSFEISGNSFEVSVLIPEQFKAGTHLVSYYIYEKDSKGTISNFGNLDGSLEVLQVPTNLEVFLEDNKIKPGTSLKAKVILRDQTGEKIDAKVYAAIKNQKGEIVQKFEERTDIEFEYFVALNEFPKEWVVSSYSEGFTSKMEFTILENSEISLELVNQTLIVSNLGNVPYNESVSVLIGAQEVLFNPDLRVGETKEFIITAPKGVYEITVGGISSSAFLTGNAVSIKEASLGKVKTMNFVWIFIILILLVAFLILFRRFRRRRNFRRPKVDNDKERIKELRDIKANRKNVSLGMFSSNLKSEISLSINGSKQDASVMCLNFKNYEEIKDGEGNVRETIQRLVDSFEGQKGFVYDNKENLFFVLAPSRTRTFQNEMSLVEFADKSEKILREHNKKFKRLIHFGISLNYGTIVTSENKGLLKFMSMGTFMTTAKKIAMRSREHVYLSSEFKSRLGRDVKTELRELGSISAHFLKEIVDRTKSSTFLEGFVARHKRDIARQEEAKKKEGGKDTLTDVRD